MNLHRGFEIYNADGKEITYQELNQEAAEFWGVPVEEEPYHMFNSARPKGKYFFDLYFGIIEPVLNLEEGLIDYHDLIGRMVGNLSGDFQINPRSLKKLIDNMAPLIKLVRHWQDKGYKIYSTRGEREEPLSEEAIKQLKEKWAKECPPSYAKFGDIQDFNPYLEY